MNYIGIDIGSTCAKIIVMNENKEILYKRLSSSGWSSVETGEEIALSLDAAGFPVEQAVVVATGYGRVSVPYADKTVTEITCHGLGAVHIFQKDYFSIIDIGGQDTKIIRIEEGMVKDFVMNDKCSAGTGRFLDVMGNSLALKPDALCELARKGQNSGVHISSMCTVFAESEVIALSGKGEPKENIAYAIVDSIADKVVSQAGKLKIENGDICLTGGLCECVFLKEMLEKKLRTPVITEPLARYAGAVGAALKGMTLRRS